MVIYMSKRNLIHCEVGKNYPTLHKKYCTITERYKHVEN